MDVSVLLNIRQKQSDANLWSGRNPLDVAIRLRNDGSNQLDVAALLQNEPRRRMLGIERNPLDVSIRLRNEQIVRMLRDRGATTNTVQGFIDNSQFSDFMTNVVERGFEAVETSGAIASHVPSMLFSYFTNSNQDSQVNQNPQPNNQVEDVNRLNQEGQDIIRNSDEQIIRIMQRRENNEEVKMTEAEAVAYAAKQQLLGHHNTRTFEGGPRKNPDNKNRKR